MFTTGSGVVEGVVCGALVWSRMLSLTFCSMAPVVSAGEDGWSVMVVDEAPERADIRDGRAVAGEWSQCKKCLETWHL